MSVVYRMSAFVAVLCAASCNQASENSPPVASEQSAAATFEPNEVLAGIEEGEDAVAFVPIGDAFVEIPYANLNGLAVYGGDMLMGSHEDVQEASLIFREAARNGASASSLAPDAQSLVPVSKQIASAIVSIQGFGPTGRRWPTKTIPYRVDASISDADLKSRIAGAIADWNATGLVNFVPEASASDTIKKRTNTLIFQDAAGNKFSCSAFVGHRVKKSEQTISLNPAWVGAGPAGSGKHSGCRRGSIVHEIGHSLGLSHEHMRSNRGSYLKVASTISDDDDNYGVLKTGEQHTDYDLCSIMHYGDQKDGSTWFELTDTGKTEHQTCVKTLATQTGQCSKVGQRCQLSPRDLEAIRIRMSNASDG